MKKKILLICLVAILGFNGCTRPQEIDIPDDDHSIIAITESLSVTKTVVEEGTHVYWEPGDEIAVFIGERSVRFTTDITSPSETATFKGTLGNEKWPEKLDLWAVYPFSENVEFDGETITAALPSEQVAREGSFIKGLNLSIAHSDSNTLQFHNVGGGIRFCVMEEGIRKVLFEGLSGELVSGTLKIGLDKSGKPIVKDVSDGSQFITLLPPAGKDTFDPGAWYYIVAIPGALKGGYKLRFYKDSDYARKVSEKAVEIERNIFGSIENADEGIEYEATTTKFPNTENEWDDSRVLTAAIGETLESIRDKTDDINVLADQLLKAEGVDNVLIQPGHETISVLQKDSVIVNYILGTGGESISTRSNPIGLKRAPSKRDPNYMNVGKNRVLVSAPFQDDIYMPLETWQELLSPCFDEVVIRTNEDPIMDNRPDITSFLGEELCQYDLIIIATHGGTGYFAKMKDSFWDAVQGHKGEPDELSRVYGQTILTSCTEYDEKGLQAIKNSLSMEEIAIVGIEKTKSNGKKYIKYYLAMTPDFIGKSRFDGIGVMLQACSSAYYHSSGQAGSMVQTFLNQGASFVTGYLFEEQYQVSAIITTDFLYSALKGGLSVYDAYYYWQNSVLYPKMNQALVDATQQLGKDYSSINYTFFKIYPEDKRDIFLRDYSPYLNEPVPEENNMRFSWNTNLSSHEYSSHFFSFSWATNEEGYLVKKRVVHDVYIDNARVTEKEIEGNSIACPVSAGHHSWYVISKFMEGDTVIASYKSDVGDFTVASSTTGDIEGTEEEPWN